MENGLNSINLKLTLILLVGIIVFLILNYKEINAQNTTKDKIDLCCTWGSELKDGILTYNIKKGANNDLEQIVDLAFSEWEKNLNNIHFKNIKDTAVDIEIKFKKSSNDNQEGGHAVIYFNDNGFIDNVEISVSKTSNGTALNQTMLEHLTKHEIGHALGLGHSQFPHTIMYPVVNETVTKISKCETDAVKDANNWKFVKNDKKPKMLEQSVYICTQ
ncbi:MAG TPA: M57 family metalloprotease [Nitrososphaeraceae archaeon]|nr:M57 family metalloprotease [Nitrososphaeraceae archaeon]